uniref:Uncharacterized protein n=1 Tax=viral metagenome TaxID=1070528 RepID=A0A6C0C5T5_9ZZZZ
MSCPNNESTKLNTRHEDECKGNCDFNFSYNPNSTCELINKGDYLEIKTDGKNNITYNSQPITLNNARLYTPSLHTFDGKHTDAELILKHEGGSTNYMICLPIKATDGTGDSVFFFKQFAQHIPLEKNYPANVNVKKWSLNDVMPAPKTPFYHYIGQSPYPPCNMKTTMIVFDINHSSTINKKDLNLIKTIIKPTANNSEDFTDSTKEGFVGTSLEGFVSYNSGGANNKDKDNDTEQAMECTEYYDTDTTFSTGQKDLKPQSIDWAKIQKSTAFTVVIIIFFILFGGICIYFIYTIINKNLVGISKMSTAELDNIQS